MITAPMLASGMRVDLPQAKTAQPLDPKEPIIITVTRDGKAFVGSDEVAPAELAQAVRARLGNDRDRMIHVRGDRDVMYGEIVGVMDRLAAGGFARIALVANARSEAAPSSTQPAGDAR